MGQAQADKVGKGQGLLQHPGVGPIMAFTTSGDTEGQILALLVPSAVTLPPSPYLWTSELANIASVLVFILTILSERLQGQCVVLGNAVLGSCGGSQVSHLPRTDAEDKD